MHPTTTLVCSHESCEKTITLDVADQIPSMWWCPKHREKNLMADLDERVKALARDAAVHVIAMCCDTEGFDCVKMDLTKETDATQSLIADAIRTAMSEAEEPWKDVLKEIAQHFESWTGVHCIGPNDMWTQLKKQHDQLALARKWPTCHECGGILIFDYEEPIATCENGCYSTEWGSQENGDHWREVQKKLMARGRAASLAGIDQRDDPDEEDDGR